MRTADIVASLLMGLAICFAGASLFIGRWFMPQPAASVDLAPAMAVVLFVAQTIVWFMDRGRHGIARILVLAVALVLGIGGAVFAHDIGLRRVIFFYWLPALFSIGAALALVSGHRLEHEGPARPARQRA